MKNERRCWSIKELEDKNEKLHLEIKEKQKKVSESLGK